MPVAGLAAQLYRIIGRGPQVMTARCPHHPGEAAGEDFQRPADVLGQLPRVRGRQQPVAVRARLRGAQDGTVSGVGDVQVAEGERVSLTHQRTGTRTCPPAKERRSPATASQTASCWSAR